MDLERTSKKAVPGKPQRIKYLSKFNEKKQNRKKKLQKSLKKKKALQEMENENPGKDWKVVLREKFESIIIASGPTLAFNISRFFKEENRTLMARIVEELGDDVTKEFAKRALDSFVQGGVKRTDGPGERTMGGIFFKLIKEELGREDPMKLKAIFIKSEGAKRRKHQIRKEKKKSQKQNPQSGSNITNPPPNQNKSSNPFENVFSSLV